MVHVDYDHPVTVGENVTVGHGAILHGCTVGDNTLIGMGAIAVSYTHLDVYKRQLYLFSRHAVHIDFKVSHQPGKIRVYCQLAQE